MSDPQYPIKIQVSVYIQDDQDRIAEAGGAMYIGEIPSKEALLKNIAEALKAAEAMGMTGARVLSPSDLMSTVVSEKLGQPVAIAGPDDYTGYTEGELDAAVALITKE